MSESSSDRVSESMRVGGERIVAHRLVGLRGGAGVPYDDKPAFIYGFGDAERARTFFEEGELEPAPLLVRPLHLGCAAEILHLPGGVLPKLPLLLPRRRRTGVREIAVPDPRITRLWGRFSIDVGVAVERTAAYVERRIFGRASSGYRVFIFEDGDRYVIRAMCIFRHGEARGRKVGYVMELLHDRSVDGMRAASHLLGLALREMHDAGADAACAWSLRSSGSYPIYLTRAFLPISLSEMPKLYFGVRALDPAVEPIVKNRGLWYLSYLDDDAL